MDPIDRPDPRELGPITIGEYPSEVYQEFEERKQTLSTTPNLIQESSIIAASAARDHIGIRYDQLSIENGDMYRNRLFSASDRPENFSSQFLFQTNAIMKAFGPEENQQNDIEKIDEITEKETNPEILKQAEVLKDNLETIAHLNNIMTDAKNEIYRLAKG